MTSTATTTSTATGAARGVERPPRLEVQMWVDLVCPWCYLAKSRLHAAITAFEHPAEVVVRYRSFELDAAAPVGRGRPVLEMLGEASGRGLTAARAMAARVVEAAAESGLVLDFERAVAANTFDAHRLVQLGLASGGPAEQGAVLERFYSAHFSEGKAIDDHVVLQRIAAEAGLDERRVAAVLAADDYAAQVRADEAEASRRGIAGVPYTLVGGVVDLSGAQPVEAFLLLLHEAWDQLHPSTTVAS